MKLVLAWAKIDTADWSAVDESASFDDAEEVIAAIRRLGPTFHEEAPPLAILRRPNGDTLAIGMGTPVVCPDDEDDDELDGTGLTVLNFARKGMPVPTFTSKAAQPFPGTLTFYYHLSDSEFGGDAAVPLEAALAAIREFAAGEGIPTAIEWQMD